jgi:hypothetical protein
VLKHAWLRTGASPPHAGPPSGSPA